MESSFVHHHGHFELILMKVTDNDFAEYAFQWQLQKRQIESDSDAFVH